MIGAGIAGLTCARTLAENGINVTVFDKSRGVGGRTSTRRSGEHLRFNHGAQYFTVMSEEFGRHVKNWLATDVITSWDGRVVVLNDSGRIEETNDSKPRYIGTSGMNAVAKFLADGLNVTLKTRIESLASQHGQWVLNDEHGESDGAFDVVVVAIPSSQAAELLAGVHPFADRCQSVKMLPTMAAMVSFDQPLNVDFDAAFVQSSKLAWAMRFPNLSATNTDCWTLHGTNEWSEQIVDNEVSDSAAELLQEFISMTGEDDASVQSVAGHRWRYAVADEPLEALSLCDANCGLFVCGDWCVGNRVESAWASGQDTAKAILDSLGI